MNNILNHSKATNATIDLRRKGNELILVITDNGQGCDISEKREGVGLLNITSRAELYGGRVVIVSKPDEGFELKVILPCQTVKVC